MQFETPACTILFLYQNHQDTPSKIWDLYKSILMLIQPEKDLYIQINVNKFVFTNLYKKNRIKKQIYIYWSIPENLKT